MEKLSLNKVKISVKTRSPPMDVVLTAPCFLIREEFHCFVELVLSVSRLYKPSLKSAMFVVKT